MRRNTARYVTTHTREAGLIEYRAPGKATMIGNTERYCSRRLATNKSEKDLIGTAIGSGNIHPDKCVAFPRVLPLPLKLRL